MLEGIISYINGNQGLVTVVLFVLSIMGFLIKKLFFSETGKTNIQKQKSGDNSVNIQSGRDTNYGNK